MPFTNSSEYEEIGSEALSVENDTSYDDSNALYAYECNKLCIILDKIDDIVSLYVLIPLVIIGITFNFASIGALFNNKLHLRRSLIQLFIFLNISDV